MKYKQKKIKSYVALVLHNDYRKEKKTWKVIGDHWEQHDETSILLMVRNELRKEFNLDSYDEVILVDTNKGNRISNSFKYSILAEQEESGFDQEKEREIYEEYRALVKKAEAEEKFSSEECIRLSELTDYFYPKKQSKNEIPYSSMT